MSKGHFYRGFPYLKGIKYFDLLFCHNHSLTKPNICAKFEQNRCRIWASAGFHAGLEEIRKILAFWKAQVLFTGLIGIWRCCFCEGRKTGEPGWEPSEQGGNERQTQPACGTGPKSNPGRIGGRRALSPMRQPFPLFPNHEDEIAKSLLLYHLGTGTWQGYIPL